MSIIAGIRRVRVETLNKIEDGDLSVREVLNPAPFSRWGLPPEACCSVLADPDEADFSGVKSLALHQHFDMILFQLDPSYRMSLLDGSRERQFSWREDTNRPLTWAVAGARKLRQQRESEFIRRACDPVHVRRIHEALQSVSKEAFLEAHTDEPPQSTGDHQRLYRWRDLKDPKWRQWFGNVWYNLRGFYAAAAEQGEATLHSKG